MLYDMLGPYRAFLRANYSNETARKYYEWIARLLQGQNLVETAKEINIPQAISHLKSIEHKNEFSQAKNALLHFLAFENIKLSSEIEEAIKELEKQTRKKYRKFHVIDYNAIQKTIDNLKNKKLKMSYQVMMRTGLRVSELAQIRKCDCDIFKTEITFHFIAKGGENDIASLQNQEYHKIYDDLKNYLNALKNDDKVFYSSNYLQQKAKELKFQCHDLRRIFAKLEYRKTKSKTEVMKKLRHSSIKNTKIYLRSKIEF